MSQHMVNADDFTTIRDLSGFDYCPLCGSEVENDRVPEGIGERIEVYCPEHGKLVFVHTGLDVPS